MTAYYAQWDDLDEYPVILKEDDECEEPPKQYKKELVDEYGFTDADYR